MDVCDTLRVSVSPAERTLQTDVGAQRGRIDPDHRVLLFDECERGRKRNALVFDALSDLCRRTVPQFARRVDLKRSLRSLRSRLFPRSRLRRDVARRIDDRLIVLRYRRA